MRKLSLAELFKTGLAFAGASTIAADAGLLALHRLGGVDTPPGWYVTVPLSVWAVAAVPATFTLGSRLLRQIDPRPGRITAHHDDAPPQRAIPFTAHGRPGTLFASSIKTIFGESLAPAPEPRRPTAWTVPIDGNPVQVREADLLAFLTAAHRRDRHQFSRRYWTQRHRPQLPRQLYEAYMRLLTENNLVDGRHGQGGASGRLVTRPRAALAWLKYESPRTLS